MHTVYIFYFIYVYFINWLYKYINLFPHNQNP